MNKTCDKCGKEVPDCNNLANLMRELLEIRGDVLASATVIPNVNRHLLPVLDGDTNLICEGSPSRAQYLEGQHKDTRGYPYLPESENDYRNAYRSMLAKFPLK